MADYIFSAALAEFLYGRSYAQYLAVADVCSLRAGAVDF